MIQPVPRIPLIARKVNGDAGFSPVGPELGGVPMKTYSAYVCGEIGRRVYVEATGQQEAESEAIEEFRAIVGAEGDVEVIEIEEVEEEV